MPVRNVWVDESHLEVIPNLHRFLEHFGEPDYIFIDQICIDQHNIEEKNRQAGMMSGIYSRCRSMPALFATRSV